MARVQYRSLARLSASLLSAYIFTHIAVAAEQDVEPSSLCRLAVLDFGEATISRLAADVGARNLRALRELSLVDRDQSRVAALGVGYTGSLNLSVDEARNLGAAIGCDYYILGDA